MNHTTTKQLKQNRRYYIDHVCCVYHVCCKGCVQ